MKPKLRSQIEEIIIKSSFDSSSPVAGVDEILQAVTKMVEEAMPKKINNIYHMVIRESDVHYRQGYNSALDEVRDTLKELL